MVETLTYRYTSQPEMESIFSVDGIELRFDDDDDDALSPTELDYLDDVIDEATDEVNLYLLDRYNASDLVNNLWVRRQASYIACHRASIRRGNPDQYLRKYEEVIAQLQAVQSEELNIPRLPLAYDSRPGHSNLVVDHRYRNAKIRVDQESSSGGSYPEQDADRAGVIDTNV